MMAALTEAAPADKKSYNMQKRFALNLHADFITALSISENGQFIASAAHDGTVHVTLAFEQRRSQHSMLLEGVDMALAKYE